MKASVLLDPEVKGCNVNEEKNHREGGALRGRNIDGGGGACRTLENHRAATLPYNCGNPGDQVLRDPTFPNDAGQSWVVDIVKPRFEVHKKGRHLQPRPLQGFHVVHKGEAGIICSQPTEGAALVRLDQAPRAGHEKEACHNYPFQDLRNSLPEYDDHKGGG